MVWRSGVVEGRAMQEGVLYAVAALLGGVSVCCFGGLRMLLKQTKTILNFWRDVPVGLGEGCVVCIGG